MAAAELKPEAQMPSGTTTVVPVVTVIMATVVGLTFLFGFGNVLNLALRLGVPVWVAPLVAPAVDLSILGLLLGNRHLALAGATTAQLQPARRLLIFASVVTLALNVTGPIVEGAFGRAAFDAVGPLLLIGWAEVGPNLLRSLTGACQASAATVYRVRPVGLRPMGDYVPVEREASMSLAAGSDPETPPDQEQRGQSAFRTVDDLLERARKEDAHHWAAHRRPISADTLRKRLRIGAARSRLLVATVRAELPGQSAYGEIAAQIRG